MSLKSLVHESKDVGRLISSKFTSSISFFSQAEKSSRDDRSCLKRTDITMGESLHCKDKVVELAADQHHVGKKK